MYRVYLKESSEMNVIQKDLDEKIKKYYHTGGNCLYFGTFPFDESTVFVYEKFTAICFDNPQNVDEYDSMLNEIKEDPDGKFLEVKISLY